MDIVQQAALWAEDFAAHSPLNVVKELDNLRIFESPLLGAATADDPLFRSLQEPEIVGPHHLLPHDWLGGARTVISFFLPFSQQVRESNKKGIAPSIEWTYGRIEGQEFVNALSRYLKEQFEKAGIRAVVPSLDTRFKSSGFKSNWSERHVSFIAGLGTFGLSKSLITAKGSAGRCSSLITEADCSCTPRPYSDLYEYCSKCGTCIRRCPADAISEEGKKHEPCSAFLDEIKKRYKPRYGCGKCQTSVPCENRIPAF